MRSSFTGLIANVTAVKRAEPLRYGVELCVHTIAGAPAAGGELVIELPAGRSLRARIDAMRDDTADVIAHAPHFSPPGRPPGASAVLTLRCDDLAPSDVPRFARVESPGEAAPPAPPPSAWAAVLSTVTRFEHADALYRLSEGGDSLLANGQPAEYLVGPGRRSFAEALALRMRAVHGGSEEEWSYLSFYMSGIAPSPEELAQVIESARAVGVGLTRNPD